MNRLKEWILNDRIESLIRASVLGVLLAIIAYIAADYLGNEVLQSSITLLFLSLPTFFVLWVFRTYDVEEQLKKAEKQLNKTEENTDNSTFFECARLLATQNALSEKIALEQLVYLRRETSFDKGKIDILTKNMFLENKVLDSAQLSGLDLSGAKLNGASLIKTNLTGADLTRTDLTGTDLTETDLRDANLEKIIFDSKTNFSGTLYNSRTIFTGTDFENNRDARDEAGMIYKD